MDRPELYWLPEPAPWPTGLGDAASGQAMSWDELVALACHRLDYMRTGQLDAALRRSIGSATSVAQASARIALLGSATLTHLSPSIRVGCLRRGIPATTYVGGFGQYLQELTDPASGLHRFKPTILLLALDARHVTAGIVAGTSADDVDAAIESVSARLVACWRRARDSFGCAVLQQTLLPVLPPLLGSNEQRLPGSPAAMVARFNARLCETADREGVNLLSLDAMAARHGMFAWHDPALWHLAKQEVRPAAAPFYGDLVARLVAATTGRARKCLVLDLDNILWGGIAGEAGPEGIALGQGSAEGEAFLAVQEHLSGLARRGIILAACSKSDEAAALAPFERHREMRLQRADFAAFMANWDDKPANIRRIAAELGIGLDAIVFLDDDPFERDLARRALPPVAVPTPPGEPALIPQCLADAGYFEAVAITAEDRTRVGHYRANRQRAAAAVQSADLPSYLEGLGMRLLWRRVDEASLKRAAQLLNKTNQFNLTGYRATEAEMLAVMADPQALALHFRLVDRFGDNGIIAVIVARRRGERDLLIEAWAMSCRVIGRGVEDATLDALAATAARFGTRRLIGRYRPTARNGMVAGLYQRLGFRAEAAAPGGGTESVLDLEGYVPRARRIAIEEA